MEGLVWHTVTISSGQTDSAEVDLGQPFRSLVARIGTIDSGTVTIKTSDVAGGTYQTLSVISTNDADDDAITCSSSSGAFNLTVPFFGWQHLKLTVATATTDRTCYVAGFD